MLAKIYQAMVLAINIEQFCGGLGTAAFVAFLMSLCNQRFSATQYALLSSLMAVSRDILSAPGGAIAAVTGLVYIFLNYYCRRCARTTAITSVCPLELKARGNAQTRT